MINNAIEIMFIPWIRFDEIRFDVCRFNSLLLVNAYSFEIKIFIFYLLLFDFFIDFLKVILDAGNLFLFSQLILSRYGFIKLICSFHNTRFFFKKKNLLKRTFRLRLSQNLITSQEKNC